MTTNADASTLAQFQRLIAPITLDEFFADYWEKKVLYIPRNDPSYYRDILTFEDVSDYLSRTDLRYPYIRLVQAGQELPLNTYAYDSVFGENVFQGNLDLDKLFHLYNNGATMCMQLQHLALPKLRSFTNHIERLFEFRTQSTLFLTPPKSQGFTAHFDSHDFFIFQIHGEKQWLIYDDSVELPLARNRVLDSEVNVQNPPSFSPLIRPGDLLYVPRGVFHEALTNNGASLQISLGVFPHLWCDILHKMIDELSLSHSLLRQSAVTPTISDEAQIEDRFASIVELLKRFGEPSMVVADLKRKAASKQSQVCENRLMDLEALPDLSLTSELTRRDIQVATRHSEDAVTLFYYDKEIELPRHVRAEVEFILESHTFCLNDIPSNLDDAGRLSLARLLIVEGLLQFSIERSRV